MWLYYRFWLVIGFNDSFLFSHKYSVSFHSLLYHSCLVPCWLCPHRHVTRLWAWMKGALQNVFHHGWPWHWLTYCWPSPAQWFSFWVPQDWWPYFTVWRLWEPSVPLSDPDADWLTAHLLTLGHWSFSGLSYRSLVGIFLYSDMDHTIVVATLDSPSLIVLPLVVLQSWEIYVLFY
jgi:hypothetical protein